MEENYRANTRFADVLTHYINRGLQKYVGESMTKQLLGEIYVYVRQTVDETFGKSKLNFTSKTKEWISQQLYSSIKIGKPELIFTSDSQNAISAPKIYDSISISDLPVDELRTIGSLFSDADFAHIIAGELRRRAP